MATTLGVVRDGLGHSSVAVTQLYLPTDRARIEEMIARSDWTRSKKPATRKNRRVGAASIGGEAEAPDARSGAMPPGVRTFRGVTPGTG